MEPSLLEALTVGGSIAGVLATLTALIAIVLDGVGVAVSLFGMAYVALLLAAVCRIALLRRAR